jgi:DUF917 family protein
LFSPWSGLPTVQSDRFHLPAECLRQESRLQQFIVKQFRETMKNVGGMKDMLVLLSAVISCE